MASDAASRFWRHSIEIYGRPGVEAACLGLQDRLRLDVNLLLLCCWAGAEGRRLSEDDMAWAIAAAADWQEQIVRPLRAARRRLEIGFPGMPGETVEALRRRLGDIELECERVEQMRLAAVVADHDTADPSASVAIANLEIYLSRLGCRPAPPDCSDLRTLLMRCFPAAERTLIDAAFCD